MNIIETIKELEERLDGYISEMNIKMLEHTPFIVEVGALTVGTDDNGVAILQNKEYPMQFSKNAVEEICSLSFRNCNNKTVKPKVYAKNEWYRKQIVAIRTTLNELHRLAM